MPNFDLDTSDGRTAWLEARRRGVGASDIAAILGRSSWKTAYHVYHEKLGSWVQADNPRMRWGRKLEDLVAQEYAELTGRFVFRPEETLLRSKAYPWMFASLDRLVHEVEDRSCLGREIILECKTAAEDRGDWGEPGTDQVPEEYLLQAAHQMLVSGHDAVDLAVFFRRTAETRVYRLPRNDSVCANVLRAATDFWQMVQQKVEPALDWQHPAMPELMNSLYQTLPEKVAELGADALIVAREYQKAREREEHCKGEAAALRARLQYLMRDAEVGVLPGGGRVYHRLVKRRGYEVKAGEYRMLRGRLPGAEED